MAYQQSIADAFNIALGDLGRTTPPAYYKLRTIYLMLNLDSDWARLVYVAAWFAEVQTPCLENIVLSRRLSASQFGTSFPDHLANLLQASDSALDSALHSLESLHSLILFLIVSPDRPRLRQDGDNVVCPRMASGIRGEECQQLVVASAACVYERFPLLTAANKISIILHHENGECVRGCRLPVDLRRPCRRRNQCRTVVLPGRRGYAPDIHANATRAGENELMELVALNLQHFVPVVCAIDRLFPLIDTVVVQDHAQYRTLCSCCSLEDACRLSIVIYCSSGVYPRYDVHSHPSFRPICLRDTFDCHRRGPSGQRRYGMDSGTLRVTIIRSICR